MKCSSPRACPVLQVLVVVIVQLIALASAQCPAKCICFRTTVRCMFQQLERIPEVSSNTTILDLRFNKIREIPAGAFHNLKHLNTLLLNNNHIVRLQNGVFNGLKELRYLYLYKNRIRNVESRVFQGLTKLEQLYLHFNDLVEIHPDTFSHVTSLERLFLHNNKLQKIPYGAFKNMGALRRLRLDSNALVCDCEMAWLAKQLRAWSKQTQAAATCQSPANMQGRSLTAVDDADFHCNKPRILEDPRDVEVNFGGTVYFTCKADGDPKPDIVWMRDSNEVNLSDPRFSKLSDGTLMIEKAVDADVGSYECTAKNSEGATRSRAAKMLTRSARSKPYFRRTPLDQSTEVGGTVKLHCAATGEPTPEVAWSRDDLPVPVGQRFQISNSISSDNALTITNIQREDAGVYKCTASNFVGRISAVAQIIVNETKSLPKVVPTFTTRPDNLTVKTGGRATLRCAADGSPTPAIAWYKDGRQVAPVGRVAFTQGHLTVDHVKESDSGLYVCRATNSQGYKETSAHLHVVPSVGFETPRTAPRTTPAGAAGPSPLPRLVASPYDMDAPKGSTVELPCKAVAEPKPSIAWTKDRIALVLSTRHKLSAGGSLYISQIDQSDAGIYECTASNPNGAVRASGRLSIKDVVALPGDRFVRIAFQEASVAIDKAVNDTLDKLFAASGSSARNHGELFRQSRFPNAAARGVARAANIYEQTLANIKKHVDAGMSVNLTEDFNYKQLLSATHLALVANLSGCMIHRTAVNCSDMCFHSKYRSVDGTCNNLMHPMWGASLTGFRRILKPAYENGLGMPIGWKKSTRYNGHVLPSARLVSTTVISTDEVTRDDRYTHMLMQWGQFLDHDLDHALPSVTAESWDGIDCKKSCEYAAPCYPIEIPPNDPRVKNRRCIDFVRSSAVCGSGHTSVFFDAIVPREQINQLTTFIDASQVYGFSEEVARDLRDLTRDHGTLREGIRLPDQKHLLPLADNQPNDCRRDPLESDIGCFLAGDIRSNEQLGLLAMHTIWFREHNRIAAALRTQNPHWDGDMLYHESRKIVGAQIQHITYSQWLPLILGPVGMEMLGPYTGYDPNVNPSISNVFATAALRFGHSLINPVLSRLNKTYQSIPQGDISLGKAFFSPWRLVEEGGVDPLMRGMYATPAKLKLPTQSLNKELTERLFEVAHAVALDLAAINIQRGRDHGMPGYNEWRKVCNLTEVTSFEQLRGEISSEKVIQTLKELYGHPGNIDVWVGGILEDVEEGAKVGPTFRCLLVEQFKRLRAGDRFWYENPSVFKPEQLTQIKQASISRALCDNGDDIPEISRDVFVLPRLQTPSFVPCEQIPTVDMRAWAECCNDCSNSGRFNTLTRLSSIRSRRSIDESEGFSYPSEKPSNQSKSREASKIRDKPSENSLGEGEEERLEGIESALIDFQRTIKHLRRKLRKLEHSCQKHQPHHDNKCMDTVASKSWRLNGEVWQSDKCTQCQCKEKQITCVTEKCAPPACSNPVITANKCCATCT